MRPQPKRHDSQYRDQVPTLTRQNTLVDALVAAVGSSVDRWSLSQPAWIETPTEPERERGITILSKNTAVTLPGDTRINISLTPLVTLTSAGEVGGVLGIGLMGPC